jgi:hypothetical protein
MAGEDVVTWAVRTGRIMASSANEYRRRLDHGEITESAVEALYPAMSGQYVNDIQASSPRSGPVSIVSRHPARSGNAYAASPVVDRIREANPNEFRAAARVSPAPKLFGANHNRDLPIVMASGMDPAILLQVPWQARHRIAAESDPGRVFHLLETYADDPDAAEYDFGPGSRSEIDQDPADVAARSANSGYEQACMRWAIGPVEPVGGPNGIGGRGAGPIGDREYRELFPET